MIEQGWPLKINNIPQDLHGYWKARDNLCIVIIVWLYQIVDRQRCYNPFIKGTLVLQSVNPEQICVYIGQILIIALNSWSSSAQFVINMVVLIKKNHYSSTLYHLGHEKKIDADYFLLGTQDYLLLVDFISKYLEVLSVTSKSAKATVQAMKTIFFQTWYTHISN